MTVILFDLLLVVPQLTLERTHDLLFVGHAAACMQ